MIAHNQKEINQGDRRNQGHHRNQGTRHNQEDRSFDVILAKNQSKTSCRDWMTTSETLSKATSEALTAENISADGKSATFTIALADPKPSGAASYVYPASMAATDADIIGYSALATQDGTLTSLASSLDACIASTTLTALDGLPSETPMLINQLAICAFTQKDSAGANDLTSSITQLTMSDGPNTYTVDRTAAEGPIYVAIRSTSNATIIYTATDGPNSYTKTVNGKTYGAGKMYPVSVRKPGSSHYYLYRSGRRNSHRHIR